MTKPLSAEAIRNIKQHLQECTDSDMGGEHHEMIESLLVERDATVRVNLENLRKRLLTMIAVKRHGKTYRVIYSYEPIFRSRSRHAAMHYARHMRQTFIEQVKWSTIS